MKTVNYNAIDASETNLYLFEDNESYYLPIWGSNCVNLETINIGNSVKNIPDSVFGSSKAKIINMGNSVQKIGGYAFGNCENLERIEIPSSVTQIGSNTFNDCPNLQEIIIRKSEGSISGAPWSNQSTVQVIWQP